MSFGFPKLEDFLEFRDNANFIYTVQGKLALWNVRMRELKREGGKPEKEHRVNYHSYRHKRVRKLKQQSVLGFRLEVSRKI